MRVVRRGGDLHVHGEVRSRNTPGSDS
jgi:hypothetical protein